MTPPPPWNFSENSPILEGEGVPYTKGFSDSLHQRTLWFFTPEAFLILYTRELFSSLHQRTLWLFVSEGTSWFGSYGGCSSIGTACFEEAHWHCTLYTRKVWKLGRTFLIWHFTWVFWYFTFSILISSVATACFEPAHRKRDSHFSVRLILLDQVSETF